VIYDGFWFTTYSPAHVYPCPDSLFMATVPWIIVEEWVHCQELLSLAGEGVHYDKAKVMSIPLNSSGQSESSYRQNQDMLGHSGQDLNPEMIRLQHLLTPTHFRTLANDDVVIRDVDNFYWHGKIPAVQGVQTIDPESFWPIGAGHMLVPNQKMMNILVNSVIDHLNMSRFWRFKYRSGSGIQPHMLLQSTTYPISMENMNDLDVLNPPEIKQDIAWFKDVIERSNETISGYYGSQKGTASGAPNTATSDSIFQSEGNKRIQADIMTYEQLGLLEEARQCSANVDQFMPKEVEVRLSGGQGNQFKKQTQADITGEFDYRVGGISEQMNLAVFQQQMAAMYGQIKDAQQFVQMPDGRVLPVPLIDAYNMVKSMLEPTLGQSTNKVLYAPEVFGQPLSNAMLQAAGMPQIPALDNMAPGGPNFGGGRLPTSGNPVDIIANANKPRIAKVA
jgi:hypothetical protein